MKNGKSMVSYAPYCVKVIEFHKSNVLSKIMVRIFKTLYKKKEKNEKPPWKIYQFLRNEKPSFFHH